jgi:beta-glucosidase
MTTAANPRTAVVLESGGPDLTPWRDRVGAILEAWYPGGPGATGVAHVLFGDVDPGGRLPVTFPADQGQIPTAGDPAAYPGIGINVDYKEGVLAGYRWYDSRHETPAFPFGFGLSYTSFGYSALNVTPAAGGDHAVHVTITNTGTRQGWAVPELYIHIPAPAGLTQPPAQLKGFAKLSLAPGQRRTATITLNAASFSYWNAAQQSWQVAPGCDTVMVGSSSRDLPLRTQVAAGRARCRRAPAAPKRRRT